ncbi:ATP-binding protein [Serpentinicella alkaliphila]|uniref:histidine kinase n=1 Tax=Serpentinicella alkaliphila TaxID=1734049 RepID=A0A4R2TIG2_9FIRM|nr:ATP-binding protein [Serpentinicella alkaliphila]QUH25956.1 hypothetical protein HZR23_09565 [Serpentinicella alkaliphila]TCQ02062.1 histidine kinase/DNA gyrase B/HSP90-like ATPase [Serpentinicella alkaliphila]
MIERILLNLLSSAIKVTGSGGKIEATVYDQNDRIAISVKDNEIGVPEEKLESIFHRFVQVDSTLSRRAGGLGIGSFISKVLSRAA